MRKKIVLFIVMTAFAVTSTGCGSYISKEQRLGLQQAPQGGTLGLPNGQSGSLSNNTGPSMLQAGRSGANAGETSAPIIRINGKAYVAATDLASGAELNSEWDAENSMFQMGVNDPSYELKAGSAAALVDEEEVKLPAPTLLQNSRLYVPVEAIQSLFGNELQVEVSGNTVVFHPSGEAVMDPIDGPEEANTGSELDFEDDPNDPFKGEDGAEESALGPEVKGLMHELDTAAASAALHQISDWNTMDADPVLKNININGLISRGKRYLGVKYKFGAKPYAQSGRFDCSSYTRYLYGKYGISLPRTARAQSKRGTAVSRKNLRKGDLMYFYVPGRFKTNKTIGHVGIYIGNQKMLHSSPQPKNGVQITNINKAYWKKTYLKSRRVAY